jgi:hypothetical protein
VSTLWRPMTPPIVPVIIIPRPYKHRITDFQRVHSVRITLTFRAYYVDISCLASPSLRRPLVADSLDSIRDAGPHREAWDNARAVIYVISRNFRQLTFSRRLSLSIPVISIPSTALVPATILQGYPPSPGVASSLGAARSGAGAPLQQPPSPSSSSSFAASASSPLPPPQAPPPPPASGVGGASQGASYAGAVAAVTTGAKPPNSR